MIRGPLQRLAILLALTLFTAACGTTRGPSAPTGDAGQPKVGKPYRVGDNWDYPEENPHYDEVGMASWYGSKFHGRKTANGERFDMNALSGAHRTLAMPSFVRVTNLSNGRSLVLRVNDRGPFAPGRIIDVSRRAAQLLGFERMGLARVRVQAVQADGTPFERPERRQIASASGSEAAAGVTVAGTAPTGFLLIQVGAFSSRDAVQRVTERLSGVGPLLVQTVRVSGNNLYRVRIGPYTERHGAEAAYREAVRRGFADATILDGAD